LTTKESKRWFSLGDSRLHNKEVIPLLKNIMGVNYPKVVGSVQHLEYSIASVE
jgi:hypothetical protein